MKSDPNLILGLVAMLIVGLLAYLGRSSHGCNSHCRNRCQTRHFWRVRCVNHLRRVQVTYLQLKTQVRQADGRLNDTIRDLREAEDRIAALEHRLAQLEQHRESTSSEDIRSAIKLEVKRLQEAQTPYHPGTLPLRRIGLWAALGGLFGAVGGVIIARWLYTRPIQINGQVVGSLADFETLAFLSGGCGLLIGVLVFGGSSFVTACVKVMRR